VLTTFISSKFSNLLAKNKLDTFEKVWDHQVNWFEEPNQRRGGWSGVGRITLKDEKSNNEFGAFLKKQNNHCRTSFLHPFKGVPTFQREFEMMRYLATKQVLAPEVLFFARNPSGSLETTLMTKELTGFLPLEELTEQLFQSKRPSLSEQNIVINAVAKFARHLHDVNIQHRSFYPKHIFINTVNGQVPEVAVIDLEKSRVNRIPFMRSVIDLSVLNKHAKYWSQSRRMRFYLEYLGLNHLTPYAKWLCRLIIKRSTRVKRH
jgi:lipopolysaccharide kinase (Kdo/WaaP) family protein